MYIKSLKINSYVDNFVYARLYEKYNIANSSPHKKIIREKSGKPCFCEGFIWYLRYKREWRRKKYSFDVMWEWKK